MKTTAPWCFCRDFFDDFFTRGCHGDDAGVSCSFGASYWASPIHRRSRSGLSCVRCVVRADLTDAAELECR